MLYKLNLANPELSDRVQIRVPADLGIFERHIETFFTTRLSELISENDLLLIGRERPFQEEGDLLALDKDGVLYIFELKRWESREENILQVLRYGQKFGRFDYDRLNHFTKQLNPNNTNIEEIHQKHFGLDKPLEKSKFNSDQVFVLVTNGADTDTISAMNYWAEKGIRIKCAPYRIYDVEGSPFIQFDTFNSEAEVVSEKNTGYFVVNTNKTWDEIAWQHMLGNLIEGRASAFGVRCSAVRNISKNSVVYLYHTGVGVIARGEAKSSWREDSYGNIEENFIPLKFDWALEQPKWQDHAIKAWMINKQMNSGYRFRQTAFSISEEMSNVIDSIADEMQNIQR